MVSFRRRLLEALGGTLPQPLTEAAVDRLARLESLLLRYGRAVDLTGFDEPETLLRRYFAEPLAALGWLPTEGNAWDLGSGGGSPALPLAVASGGLSWTLVEPAKRKALFLEEACRDLGLVGVRVLRARWQSVTLTKAAVVTMRGLRLEEDEAARLAAAMTPGGRLLWFSSQERLRRAGQRLVPRTDLRVGGPHRLVPAGGWLLVVERCAASGECFT